MTLASILNEFCSIESITNVKDKTFSDWYRQNKKTISSIIAKHFPANDPVESLIKSPSGTAEIKIEKLLGATHQNLKVETVHSAKGQTFDSVMLVSSNNGHGGGGYWKQWLKKEDEPARIAYVACTRPQRLLCWAIKKPSEEDRNVLEELGLIRWGSKIS